MSELKHLVERVRGGDKEAFGEVVRRFQDMAHGYAYSILGDFHLAEDAAQESFVDAYYKLDALRDPDAFPGWLRRIVFKHCDRIMRRKEVATVPLKQGMEAPQSRPAQCELAESVLNAIRGLPPRQREATTLYYINGYSQDEIASFLEVPAATVRKRLQRSRTTLKERMLTVVENTLKSNRLGDGFAETVIAEIDDPASPHVEEMEALFDDVFAQDCIGDLVRDEEGNWAYRPAEGRPCFRVLAEESAKADTLSDGQVFALVQSGKAIGVLQMFYRPWRGGLLAWVDLVGVSEAVSGEGLVAKLIEHAVSATQSAAAQRGVPPMGLVYLAGERDHEPTDSFTAMGAQLRDDFIYRLAPEDENPSRVVWYPMSDACADIPTIDLARELWRFGGLPEEKFDELYG